MIIEDLQYLYGISDNIIKKHLSELQRVLNLQQEKNIQRNLNLSVSQNVKKKLFKICIASYGFGIGGGELVPVTLANAFRERGHHITFLVIQNGDNKESPVLKSRLRPDIPVLHWNNCSANFQQIIKDYGFDLINSHNVAVEYNLFTHGVNPSVPYISTLHGGYETVPNLLTKEFITFLSQSVAAWLYLSEKNIAPLKMNGIKGAKFVKIFNAIPPLSKQSEEISGIRSKLGLSHNSIILVLASRAINDKGWDIAIETTKLLRNEINNDVRLVLIGDGENFKDFKVIADDKPYVHFLGRVNDIRTIIGDCDIGIFPSTYVGESFPLFILECFASGLPVVATDVGSIREIMTSENGEIAGGLISPKQNKELMVNEFADAIIQMIKNPETLKSAKFYAHKRAEYYNFDKLVDRYLEVFREVTKRK